MPSRPLRIGTRSSPMALYQAELVRDRLRAAHADLAAEGAIELVPIRTTGDRVQTRLLAEIGGKGLFTKEIEEALIDRRIDLAVHSLKDMETTLPPGLAAACAAAHDPRDGWSRGGLLTCRSGTGLHRPLRRRAHVAPPRRSRRHADPRHVNSRLAARCRRGRRAVLAPCGSSGSAMNWRAVAGGPRCRQSARAPWRSKPADI